MKTVLNRGDVLTNTDGRYFAMRTVSTEGTNLEEGDFRKLLPGEEPPYPEFEYDDDPGCCCIPWMVWFVLGLVIGMSCR